MRVITHRESRGPKEKLSVNMLMMMMLMRMIQGMVVVATTTTTTTTMMMMMMMIVMMPMMMRSYGGGPSKALPYPLYISDLFLIPTLLYPQVPTTNETNSKQIPSSPYK